jgi:phospholipase C
MAHISRRRLLGAAAAAAAGSLLPPSLHEAIAATPVRRGGLRAVEHVIVLMQENRSFD